MLGKTWIRCQVLVLLYCWRTVPIKWNSYFQIKVLELLSARLFYCPFHLQFTERRNRYWYRITSNFITNFSPVAYSEITYIEKTTFVHNISAYIQVPSMHKTSWFSRVYTSKVSTNRCKVLRVALKRQMRQLKNDNSESWTAKNITTSNSKQYLTWCVKQQRCSEEKMCHLVTPTVNSFSHCASNTKCSEEKMCHLVTQANVSKMDGQTDGQMREKWSQTGCLCRQQKNVADALHIIKLLGFCDHTTTALVGGIQELLC